MIDKLRIQFPSLVVEEKIKNDPLIQYFRLANGLYIGIDKNELTERDYSVLSIFTTPILIDSNLTTEQSLWKQAIIMKETEDLYAHYSEKGSFRFIHFYLQSDVDIHSFEEAVASLSFSNKIVVWVDTRNGVIVEHLDHDIVPKEELIHLKSAIASDFYTDLFIYTGEVFTFKHSVSDLYEWESSCFDLSRSQLKSKGVYQFFEIIPYILLRDTKDETRERITTLISDFTTEELQPIKVFIESGLNVSLASKTLFLHRNSLQYKVDKFIEKTGIDIKSFQGALVIYLSILSKNY